jgi:hypothetical protein
MNELRVERSYSENSDTGVCHYTIRGVVVGASRRPRWSRHGRRNVWYLLVLSDDDAAADFHRGFFEVESERCRVLSYNDQGRVS